MSALSMQPLYDAVAGLDVHKKQVQACLLIKRGEDQWDKEMRAFGTMTDDIQKLISWLQEHGCRQVVMESTGVYWKPIYNLLEGQFEVVVVNPEHVKARAGRKTDVEDAQRLAELMLYGLLAPSFIPSQQQREWRDLTRYRTTLTQERARVLNRLQKVLEDANIKLASVVSQLYGVSAQAMLRAMVGGETDPEILAQLARGRLREKREELQRALSGRIRPHHSFLMAEHLSHLDYLDEAIGHVSEQIKELMRPFEQELELLDTIPGVGRLTTEVLLAEIGPDVCRFPTAAHLASWAGLSPGNNESAGKRKSGKTRKGSPWLRGALVESAQAASRTKDTYLSAQYHKLVARRGKKKATVALAHSILISLYHMLSRKQRYHDLGADYFDKRKQEQVTRYHLKQLARLGWEVNLKPSAVPVP